MAELHPAACFRGEDGRQGRSPAFLCVQPLCPVSCSQSVKGCTPALLCVQLDGRRTQPFFLFALSLFSFIFIFPFFHFLFYSFFLPFFFSSILFLCPFPSSFLFLHSLFYILFLPFFFSPIFSFLSFFSPCGGRRARVWWPWHDLYVGRHTHV